MDDLRQKIGSLCPQFGPQFLRLAVHDAATWDGGSRTGACGTIRTPKALAYPANEGLGAALQELERLQAAYAPGATMADVIHLAGAEAAAQLGGPRIPFRPGRRDSKVTPPESRLPSFQSCLPDPTRLLAAFKRMGLSKREGVALAGAHPFGRWWSSPATFEQLHSSLEVLASPPANGASPAGDSPRASSRGLAPQAVPAFDARIYSEILKGEDPLSRHLCDDAEARAIMAEFAANPQAWLDTYARAFQKLSEAPTGLPLPRGAGGAGAGASWAQWAADFTGLDPGTVAAAAVVAGAAVGVGVWWVRRRQRQRRALML